MLVYPSILSGQIEAIASKSYAHRALILASLADKESKIYFEKSSKDIDATISCLKEMGADIKRIQAGVTISPIEKRNFNPLINPGESGSTLRFLLPLATSIYKSCHFVGSGRLPDRPIKELVTILKENGVEFDKEKLPFTTNGLFSFENCQIRGDISSQYITGLLLTGANFDKDVSIDLTSKLESKAYVDMTIDIMKNYNQEILETEKGYKIINRRIVAKDYVVEGDWSNASFYLVAGALSEKITMTGLNINSKQGDIEILSILEEFGSNVYKSKDEISVESQKRNNLEIDIKDIPDMLPILSILAASVNGGKSRFYNAKRLRIKESDRLESSAEMIRNLGGKVEEREDELIVFGTGGLVGGSVDSYNDHRIAMAATIASLISKKEINIINERAIEKSYPSFFEDFSRLGGNYDS